MKKLRYIIEYLSLKILLFIFKVLPPKQASGLAGFLGALIGSRLAVNRRARKHINLAFPDKTPEQINQLTTEMWRNLGRVIGEYPHLEKISKKHTTINFIDESTKNIIQSDVPIIFFGGHIGNWEINCLASLLQMERPVTLTYRAPNNPYVTEMLDKARTLNGRLKSYPKSRESGKHLIQTLKNNEAIGILIDQKYNEGLNIPFFNHDAMTNPVFVQLAQKYKCPLIPIRNERVKGCSFKLTVYPPVPTINEDSSPRAIEEVINDAHKLLENWISERPEQWIWLHRRWKTI